jgi:N-ethylmaleimide reductase
MLVVTPDGFSQPSPHRALETARIAGIIERYRAAAANAKRAGFDGVELMAANGHLIDQFLQDNSNKRTDRYGGSIENRARLLFEVAEALISVWGSDRVGVRIAPSARSTEWRTVIPGPCSATSRSASMISTSPTSMSSSPGSKAAT